MFAYDTFFNHHHTPYQADLAERERLGTACVCVYKIMLSHKYASMKIGKYESCQVGKLLVARN